MDFHSHAERLIGGIHKAMAVAPRSSRAQKGSAPRASAVSTRPLRKIVICSAAILLAGAASSIWFLTVHRHQQWANGTRQALVVEQPATAEPPVSPMVSPPDRTWKARIEEFVRQFVLANQLENERATVAFYTPQVDYFDEGQQDKTHISRDIADYNERWPTRHYEIEGDINLQEKVPNREYAASFKLNFHAESLLHTEWSKGQSAMDLAIRVVDGEPKISGIKEKMVRKDEGTAKAASALTSGAVMSPSPPITVLQPSPVAASSIPNVPADRSDTQKLTKVFVRKYGFSVLLPTELFPDAATKLTDANADQLVSVNGCFRVAFKVLPDPVNKAYDNCIAEFHKKANHTTIDYKVQKGSWFVVSGDSDTTGYYTKGVKRGDNVIVMELEYTGDACNIPDAMLTEISRKFDGK